MKNIIFIIQTIVSSVIIGLIILQTKGVGLGRSFGGSGEFYKSRRGIEKIVFRFTIVFVIIFLITSILSLLYT